nr:hypothetical protein BaRGS_011901 [Batillaria attramentaria]
MGDSKNAQADDMKPTRIDTSAGKVQMKLWNGMMMPYISEEPDVHFQKVADMEIRDDDFFLLSFPKSGTHWVWRIMDLLVNKTTDYGDRCTDYGFLDLQLVERVNNLDSPRILSTHLPLQYIPKQVKVKRPKLVHVYRNPKAVLVSMYFMMKNGNMMPDITLDKLEMTFSSDKGVFSKWTYYWDQVMEFEKNNPDLSIFHISYEELKLNTVESITKLAEYLGVEDSQDLIEKIADAVSFKKQQQLEEETAPEDRSDQKKFYRKGEIDDWKNYLTVAQSERLDKAIKDRAGRCRFSAKY